METMLKNQVELKNGSKKINSMLEEMDSKKVSSIEVSSIQRLNDALKY